MTALPLTLGRVATAYFLFSGIFTTTASIVLVASGSIFKGHIAAAPMVFSFVWTALIYLAMSRALSVFVLGTIVARVFGLSSLVSLIGICFISGLLCYATAPTPETWFSDFSFSFGGDLRPRWSSIFWSTGLGGLSGCITAWILGYFKHDPTMR